MPNQLLPYSDQESRIRQESRSILIALLFPTVAIILNGSMFAIALPTIRDELSITADLAAWLTIAFTLPFMMFMPLYGRLGDELGKSRLLEIGLVIFLGGSVLALVAEDFAVLFLGRLVQGTGAAGITPLSIAILIERFAAEERGRALGTWNSIAPGTSIFAPTVGGFMIDLFGWRAIFIPAIAVGIVAIWIVYRRVPALKGRPNWQILRSFDWGGVVLLGATLVLLVLFISSRPITGVEPLHDLRLLSGTVFSVIIFTVWENHRGRPLIDFSIWKIRSFSLASVSAGLRMAMMTGIGFLLPLYLADLYDLSASAIGLIASMHAVALFITIRVGGTLADRKSNRLLIAVSLGVQVAMMALLTVLPATLPIYVIALVVVVHGTGAGLSLAALHRTALGSIAPDQTGAAAGLYSMTRFGGSMLGTAFAGIILQGGLDRGLMTLDAYQLVYAVLAGMGLVGLLSVKWLRD